MDIVIKGSFSNSFQLISAIAAKFMIADKYNASVFLNVKYNQYWHKKNISDTLLSIMENESFDEFFYKVDKEFYLSVNYFNPMIENQIIIDDGVGAYRKNPFSIINSINSENKAIGKKNLSFFECVKVFFEIFFKMYFSFFVNCHFSIFKKTPINFFEINTLNKMYFIKSISFISNQLKMDCVDDNDRCIIYISQPPKLIGFKNDEDYGKFFEKLVMIYKEKEPDIKFIIKKHPMDDFDYRGFDAEIISDNMPAEIYFYKYKKNIVKNIGFSSTSLLTGKVIFDIPGIFIDKKIKSKIAGDFWVDKGFRKHLSPLIVDF